MKSKKNIILKKIIIALIPLVIAFAFYMYSAKMYVDMRWIEQDYAAGIESFFVFVILTIVCSILSSKIITPLSLNLPIVGSYIFFSIKFAMGKGLVGWDHWGSNLIFYLLFLVCLLISVIFIIYQIVIRIRKKRDSNNTESN